MNRSTLLIFMSMCVVFGMVSCSPSTNTPAASSPSSITTAVGHIVFQSERDGNAEIYIMNADGTGLTRLTDNPAFDGMPSFRWDGRRIVFTSDRDGSLDIYSMKANGTDVTRLTDHPSADSSPYYSSDGRYIIFGSERGASHSYRMNAFGKEVSPSKQSQRDNASPRFWSDQELRLRHIELSDGNWEIYLARIDLSPIANLTTHPADDNWPAWSPDHSMIVFESERDGNTEIYIMNTDGTGATRLTDHPAEDSRPSWGP